MENIIETQEGQDFFDFLDMHWDLIMQLSHSIHLMDVENSINKIIKIQEKSFDFDIITKNEYDNIIQYFLTIGPSY